MATAAEVQTMATDASCVLCLSEKQLLATMVFLLWDSFNPGVPMTATEVNTLAEDAKCITSCVSHKQLLAMIVQLLFDGSGGGGGGGGFGVRFTDGVGAPPVDGSILTQGYFDTSGPIKWINIDWPDTVNPDWRQF